MAVHGGEGTRCVADEGLHDHTGAAGRLRKTDCWYNACAESFFGTLEQELGAKANWADETEASAAVSDYIHKFYNPVPRPGTLGHVSPVDFEEQYRVHQNMAA